jgi:salicylate hydroxylase
VTARSAVVVGAGIGGLTAALALARKGLRVTLLEQTPAFGEVGAGIQVSPNASRVLHALGLEKPLAERAFLPEGVEGRTWRRGHTILRAPLGDGIRQRFGAPYYHLHRADLHAVLAEAVEATPGIDVRLDVSCAEVLQSRDVVTANTPEVNSFTADLLVGADGIKSVVREGLFGPEAPRFTGCVAWRGVVPAEAVRGADVRPVASNWMGPRAHVVTYYLRAGQLVNIVAVVEKSGWEVESWTERGEKSELLSDFAGWHPTVQALLEAIDPDACFKWALFDRDPLPRWSEGRVTLLGDACHPTLPFMAQGACMAIEDAAVLAECVDGADDVPAALQRYEGLRRERTAGIQLGSRRNKTLFHMAGPKAWLRNLSMPMLGRGITGRSSELFGYDPFAAADAR